MRRQLQVGDVVRNRTHYAPNSPRYQCPGCTRFVRVDQSHCEHCRTTFVPIASGHVQVVGTAHASA